MIALPFLSDYLADELLGLSPPVTLVCSHSDGGLVWTATLVDPGVLPAPLVASAPDAGDALGALDTALGLALRG